MKKIKFVLLNTTDNVLVCCQAVNAGEEIMINDKPCQMDVAISVGHKIACKAIKKSEKIIKYGVSIGSATANIKIGEHVHMHNMKSDYIPSHTRQAKASN